MPLGLVTDEEFELEKGSHTSSLVVKDIKVGRGEGNKEVPHALREVLAEESILGGRESGIRLATEFGLSPQTVDGYKRGGTSLNPASPKTVTARDRIASSAVDKVEQALKYITEQKLAAIEDVKDVTAVAKDLAQIADKLSPVSRDKDNGAQKTLVVIHAPAMKSLEDYEVIDVTAEKVS